MRFSVAAQSVDIILGLFSFGIWPILDMPAVRGIRDKKLLAVFSQIAFLWPTIVEQSLKGHLQEFAGEGTLAVWLGVPWRSSSKAPLVPAHLPVIHRQLYMHSYTISQYNISAPVGDPPTKHLRVSVGPVVFALALPYIIYKFPFVPAHFHVRHPLSLMIPHYRFNKSK